MEKKNLTGLKYNRWTVIGDGETLMTTKKNGKPQSIRLLTCQCECGTIRDIRQGNLVNGSSKSCGCHHKEVCRETIKEIHKTQKGSGNPNWKGGITKEWAKERNKERNTKESRLWRKNIIDRDLVCKKCLTSKFLQAHHIDNWSEKIDRRGELDNGVCLCKSCHHTFHKEYGFTGNSMEQLDLFLAGT